MPSKKSQKQQATRERSAHNKSRRDANETRLKAKRQRASELGSRSRKAVDAETKAKQAKKATLTPNQRQKARAAARRIEPSTADVDAAISREQRTLDQRIDQHLESSPSRAIFANHLDGIVNVEVEDAGILLDLDDPADYERLKTIKFAPS